MTNEISYGSPESLVPEMLEYLSRGEGFWLVVTGTSMCPTLLHETDSVFVEPLTRELRTGDIPLVLSYDRHCILHRATQIDQDTFYMQGDALVNREGPVSKSCILGVATLRRRRGKIHRLSRQRSIYTVNRRLWMQSRALGIQIARRCIPQSIRTYANEHIRNRKSH